jgi:Icc-related predicted phosphoesterase
MKILAISDNVLPQLEEPNYLRKTYSEVELIVSCGDLPVEYLDVITSTLNVPMFYVRGNHDISYERNNPGGDNLHRRFSRFKGFAFAGLEGSIRYNQEPIQYSETQMLLMVLSMAPRILARRSRLGYGLDVMITHSPIQGVHDLPDFAHRGFRSLRWMLNLFRPRYMIHGHVDTWDRRRPTVTHLGETEIININPVKVLDLEGRSPGGP